VPRLALTCEMAVERSGRGRTLGVYRSLIESRARLIYEDVQKSIDGGASPVRDPEATASLRLLLTISRTLRQARRDRGAVDLDIPEAKILLDEDGLARYIARRPRLEAHRLIEDLMLAANEAVAEFLKGRNAPTLYRVHPPPSPERLHALGAWAGRRGIDVDRLRLDQSSGLARLAEILGKRPDAAAGHMLLLRAMAQAHYAPQCLGHFALASRAYLHFTSPIRRYPDLLVHRALGRLWDRRPPLADLEAHGERTSDQERRAMEAERAVVQLMMCHVARERLGETLGATVTGVHTAGVFVRTEDPVLEALVRMESLGRGRESFSLLEDEQAVWSRQSRRKINLGDRIEVRLLDVDTRRRHISAELAEGATGWRRGGATPSKGGRGGSRSGPPPGDRRTPRRSNKRSKHRGSPR